MRVEFNDFYGIAENSIGKMLARRLFRKLGGSRVYIARWPTVANPIVEAIGMEAAQAFSNAILEGQETGMQVKLVRLTARTRTRKRAVVYRLNNRGMSAAKIARRFGVDERTIYRWIAAEKKKEQA